jgi:hypothetical protein
MSREKGLPAILRAISQESPGARLEHVMKDDEESAEAWRDPDQYRERKILPVERWHQIVWTDYINAPTREFEQIIVGPHYKWYRDEWGRAIILANHRGEFVPMFEEVWAGDPLSP